jgi:hypothetical protein
VNPAERWFHADHIADAERSGAFSPPLRVTKLIIETMGHSAKSDDSGPISDPSQPLDTSNAG